VKKTYRPMIRFSEPISTKTLRVLLLRAVYAKSGYGTASEELIQVLIGFIYIRNRDTAGSGFLLLFSQE